MAGGMKRVTFSERSQGNPLHCEVPGAVVNIWKPVTGSGDYEGKVWADITILPDDMKGEEWVIELMERKHSGMMGHYGVVRLVKVDHEHEDFKGWSGDCPHCAEKARKSLLSAKDVDDEALAKQIDLLSDALSSLTADDYEIAVGGVRLLELVQARLQR